MDASVLIKFFQKFAGGSEGADVPWTSLQQAKAPTGPTGETGVL